MATLRPPEGMGCKNVSGTHKDIASELTGAGSDGPHVIRVYGRVFRSSACLICPSRMCEHRSLQ